MSLCLLLSSLSRSLSDSLTTSTYLYSLKTAAILSQQAPHWTSMLFSNQVTVFSHLKFARTIRPIRISLPEMRLKYCMWLSVKIPPIRSSKQLSACFVWPLRTYPRNPWQDGCPIEWVPFRRAGSTAAWWVTYRRSGSLRLCWCHVAAWQVFIWLRPVCP